MVEEWKAKGQLLQELDALRSRVAQLEQAEGEKTDGQFEGPERAFRAIFDNVTEGMLLADVQSRQFVTGNKAICEMLGRKAEETRHLGVMDIYPPEDLDCVAEQFEKQAKGELTLAKDIPVMRKDGSILYVDINSVPVTLAGRTYLMSVFRETDPHKIDPILQQSDFADSYTGRPVTATEMRVLKLIVGGMSNKEIAQLLHRSVRTIEGHRAHLMHKLDADNSVELVKRAVAVGLVDLPVGKAT
jgi:PAS domain S-box-containing protein